MGFRLCGAAFFDAAAGLFGRIFEQTRAQTLGVRVSRPRPRSWRWAGRKSADFGMTGGSAISRQVSEIRECVFREFGNNSGGCVYGCAAPRCSTALAAFFGSVPADNGARNLGVREGPNGADVPGAICSQIGRFRFAQWPCDAPSEISGGPRIQVSEFRGRYAQGVRDFAAPRSSPSPSAVLGGPRQQMGFEMWESWRAGWGRCLGGRPAHRSADFGPTGGIRRQFVRWGTTLLRRVFGATLGRLF